MKKLTEEEINAGLPPYIRIKPGTLRDSRSLAVFIDDLFGEWEITPDNVMRGKKHRKRNIYNECNPDGEALQKLIDVDFKTHNYCRFCKDSHLLGDEFWYGRVCKNKSSYSAKENAKFVNVSIKGPRVPISNIKERLPVYVKIKEDSYIGASKKADFTDIVFGDFRAIVNNVVNGKVSHPRRAIANRLGVTDSEQLQIIKDCPDNEKYCKFCTTTHEKSRAFWRGNVCRKYEQAYRVENAEKTKKYKEDNKDRFKESGRRWLQKNRSRVRAKVRTRTKERFKEDPYFKFTHYLRNRLRKFIKKTSEQATTSALVGCTREEFVRHFESLFVQGMSWENYGVHGWHIDHIIPISSFDLSDPKQLAKCNHYTNLQPLWAKDNISKGGIKKAARKAAHDVSE